LPVSVKTRIGVSSADEMEEWIETLCEVKPANISLHGRTLKQLYQGSADWEAIGRAAEIVHKNGLHILGNGDVTSLSEAKEKVAKYGVDGVLIGRAAEGNPGIFNSQISNHKFSNEEDGRAQKLAWAVEHAQVYEKVFKPINPTPDDVRWFLPMRKHLAWYAHGFPGAAELRTKLMKTTDANSVETMIGEFLKN
jgi:tRNA-dihydrouridine synthase